MVYTVATQRLVSQTFFLARRVTNEQSVRLKQPVTAELMTGGAAAMLTRIIKVEAFHRD